MCFIEYLQFYSLSYNDSPVTSFIESYLGSFTDFYGFDFDQVKIIILFKNVEKMFLIFSIVFLLNFQNATNTFEEVAGNERFRFFGNINIGQDIKAVDLQNIYSAVVFVSLYRIGIKISFINFKLSI